MQILLNRMGEQNFQQLAVPYIRTKPKIMERFKKTDDILIKQQNFKTSRSQSHYRFKRTSKKQKCAVQSTSSKNFC